jgi:hypothetical protein
MTFLLKEYVIGIVAIFAMALLVFVFLWSWKEVGLFARTRTTSRTKERKLGV